MTQASNTQTIKLAQQLISIDSVTPDDKGCQTLLCNELEPSGFIAEHLRFGEVDNLWLKRGTEAPLFCFAGHTDVVPTGKLEDWDTPPFSAEILDDYLYGRGAADMKGSIAAMTIACQRFIKDFPQHKGSIAFLITSDEEGPAKDGTIKVVETLEQRNEKIDWCLVGEPSSTAHVGDTIKNGRRGSLGCTLNVKGIQGHVAYPHLASNPVQLAAPMLAELCDIQWDAGNEFFPPTTFQISNINAGTGATNVIPGELEVIFNLRFSTEITHEEIIERIESLLQKYDLEYTTNWNLSGLPFLTAEGELVSAAEKAIENIKQFKTELSTAGGTSDGRFIAPTGAQVVELGPVNKTIHQINECVAVSDLNDLEKIYYLTLKHLLT